MDLIVDDDYITEMGTYLREQEELLNSAVGTYKSILQDVAENGISKGETKKALDEFIEQVGTTTGDNTGCKTLGSAVSRYCKSFIADVDKEDKDLY